MTNLKKNKNNLSNIIYIYLKLIWNISNISTEKFSSPFKIYFW